MEFFFNNFFNAALRLFVKNKEKGKKRTEQKRLQNASEASNKNSETSEKDVNANSLSGNSERRYAGFFVYQNLPFTILCVPTSFFSIMDFNFFKLRIKKIGCRWQR